MVRNLERPSENHALRSMRLEGLEGVMEHCENAEAQAADEDDLEKARLYSRQHERATAEMLARRQQRDGPERAASEDLL